MLNQIVQKITQDPVNLVLVLLVLLIVYTCNESPKVKQHGGLLNIGDNSQDITNIHREISSTVNDTFIKKTQRCQNDVSSLQQMNLTCEIPEETVRDLNDSKDRCLQIAHDSAASSRELQKEMTQILLMKPDLTQQEFQTILQDKKDAESTIAESERASEEACHKSYEAGIICSISGVEQEQSVSFKAECEFKSNDVMEFQQALKSEVSKKLNDESDALGSAVNGLVDGLTDNAIGDQSVTEHVENTLENNLTNMFTSEDLTEMFSSMSTNQVMNLSGGAGARFNAIKQVSMVDMMAKTLSENDKYNGIISEITSVTTEEVRKAGRGLTDVTGQVADTVQHVSTEIGETARTGIETIGNMQWAIVAVVIGIVVVLVVMGGKMNPMAAAGAAAAGPPGGASPRHYS